MYSTVTVDEIVDKPLATCTPQDTLQVAVKKMTDTKCSSVIVVEEESVVGIWTEADAMRLDYSNPLVDSVRIGSLMSKPVQSISRKANLGELGIFFDEKGIRHCLVVNENGSPYSIVTRSDLVYSLGTEQYLSCGFLESFNLTMLSSVSVSASLSETVEIMRKSGEDAVLLVDDQGTATSIFTQRDLIKLIANKHTEVLSTSSSYHPLVKVPQSITVSEASESLRNKHLRYLMVEDGKHEPISFISLKTIHRIIVLNYISQLRDLLKGSDHALSLTTHQLALAGKVIESSFNSVMITEPDGTIISVNSAFTKVLGFLPHEVIGKASTVLRSDLHDEEFYRKLRQQLLEEGHWNGEVWSRRKDGDIVPQHLSITAICDDHNQVHQYAAIFEDRTRQKQIEKKIHRLANIDDLTGLPNRSRFNDKLTGAINTAISDDSQLAVLLIDFDRFNQVNATLGHEAGDQIICHFSKLLKRIIRSGDTVARLGGDTFAILLAEIEGLEGVTRIANSILNKSSDAFFVDESTLYLTTSIGISCYPQDGNTVESLLRTADTAIHRVKDMGGNGYEIYNPEMITRSQEDLEMHSRLRGAMMNNDFYLNYQPKVCLITNQTVAYEALIRWEDSKLGAISPTIFIPMVEELGLIESVSCWVLEEACRQNLDWIDNGLQPRRIAVNVSSLHIKRGTVLSDVQQVLDKLNYPPELLELEITESAFINQVDGVTDMLSKLRDMGITVAIDDFGTGYSSLSYLKKIPTDTLKIDASFVRDVTENKDDQQIVRAIIAMAHTLSLKVIAEGVETIKQANFLMDNGCDQIQGYLFSKPLASHDVLEDDYWDFNILSSAVMPNQTATVAN